MGTLLTATDDRYLRGWFTIDIVSVFPFDLVGMLSGSNEAGNLAVLRLVRLARLLKLMRVFKANRLLQRWATHVSLSFATQTCIKCLVGTAVLAHWSACLFMLVSSMAAESGVTACWVQRMKFSDHGARRFFSSSR